MFKKQYIVLSMFVMIFLSGFTFGQNVLQLVPFNGQPSTEIMTQIIADTTATGGLLPDRVYELVGGGFPYICQQIFYVENNQVLRLRAAAGPKPIIYLYPAGSGGTPQNPPGYFVRLRGGDIEMSGIALTGFFEPIDSNFNNVQGGMFRNDNEGSNYKFDNCTFSNINGQVIRCEGSTGTIKVTNCVFTNLGALSTSNFGAGKGIDLRAVAVDSLILVNNTWTNYQDRVVRHYNFSNPLAGTGNIKYTRIDHNTMFNGMGFHGLLSLGNVGEKVIITNNLFKDAFAAGEDSTDATRTAEWANTGEKYPNDLNRMTWIFTAPNDTTQWTISNNYYAVSDSGQAFFNAHTAEPIVVGSQLSWHINSRLGADSVNAFTLISDPILTNTQNLMTNLMRWYVSPTGGNKTKNTPSTLWNRATDDMDRRPIAFWINDLDAAYQTSSAAYTGSQGGFPAGDLNWFPTKKAEWEVWVTDVKTEEGYVPETFSLEQNYPNPFNPSTKITFNLSQAGFTNLAIYNLLGQKVATIVNQELIAGRHTVDFDASNLSSGVYFYTIESGKNITTMKMMLLK
ncbi:MAG: T9SS type A sorting domain-containing protein [Ignavibacteriales bacterium]|nr:T9SS type A sorting domain-containing protein [Ignavibacteriales bacterium]